jgi:hypothetical protein
LQREQSLKTTIANEKKKFISNCERRIAISKDIDIASLKKAEIEERKSDANELFKWILVAMYI